MPYYDDGQEKCPASVSGLCLQMVEGFTPCPSECERDLMDKRAAQQALKDTRVPQRKGNP